VSPPETPGHDDDAGPGEVERMGMTADNVIEPSGTAADTGVASSSGGSAPPSEPARIVYQQHATDPVVWWSTDLFFSRPDWLDEPVGPDVNPAIDWFPVVTFWQVTLDMALSSGVPAGHGHHYGPECVDSWKAVLQPANWSEPTPSA
jgi:Alpha/beta-hydrolase family